MVRLTRSSKPYVNAKNLGIGNLEHIYHINLG